MDVVGAHSYGTLVELERESFYEKKLRRWWSSFYCSDQSLLRRLLGDATSLLHTTIDWHLLEVIFLSRSLLGTLIWCLLWRSMTTSFLFLPL